MFKKLWGKSYSEAFPFNNKGGVRGWIKRRAYGTKMLARRVSIVLVGVGLISGTTYLVVGKNEVAIATVEREVIVDVSLQDKVKQFKQELLTELKECETPGYTEDDAPIILDSNKEMSIGRYMFQIKTVQWYAEKIYGDKLTRKQAVELALDEKRAEQLAHDIIFTTSSGLKDWHNCNKWKGLDGQLEVIKKLEK